MTITNFDKRMFQCARAEAFKSDFDRFNVGCVVVYKHKIIGRGCNGKKTHPIQKKYNKFRKFNRSRNYSPASLHAEVSALCSVKHSVGMDINWKKVKVYVYRVRKDGSGACARPCKACETLMRSLGITGCYYSEDINCLAYIEYC